MEVISQDFQDPWAEVLPLGGDETADVLPLFHVNNVLMITMPSVFPSEHLSLFTSPVQRL